MSELLFKIIEHLILIGFFEIWLFDYLMICDQFMLLSLHVHALFYFILFLRKKTYNKTSQLR